MDQIEALQRELNALRRLLAVKEWLLTIRTEALIRISKMGRVCPDFELCKHPICADSAGAALTAMEVLLTDQEKAEMEQKAESSAFRLLGDLRSQGWAVAVHNDYRLDGAPHTFWLFTRGNQCVKGEGRTDEEALHAVRTAINDIPCELEKLRLDNLGLQAQLNEEFDLKCQAVVARNGAETERDEAHQVLANIIDWVTKNGHLQNHGHRKHDTACAECTILNDAVACLERSADEARKIVTPYAAAQARIKELEEILRVKEAHEKELERLRSLLAIGNKKDGGT